MPKVSKKCLLFIVIKGELDEMTSTDISGESTGGRKPKVYNLDIIISVGYQAKS